MKSNWMIILALCIFVFPLTTLAASKNSQSVNIAEAVTVANTQLQPGDYKVEWNGSGPDVQVTFLQKNKPVATAPAKLESQKNPYNGAVETTTEPDNSKALQAIQFKDKSLKFGQGNGSGGE